MVKTKEQEEIAARPSGKDLFLKNEEYFEQEHDNEDDDVDKEFENEIQETLFINSDEEDLDDLLSDLDDDDA